METVKVQKGNVVKEIPVAYKGDYIAAGWGEVKTPVPTVEAPTAYSYVKK